MQVPATYEGRVELATRLYRSGAMTRKQIAKAFGLSINTINGYIYDPQRKKQAAYRERQAGKMFTMPVDRESIRQFCISVSQGEQGFVVARDLRVEFNLNSHAATYWLNEMVRDGVLIPKGEKRLRRYYPTGVEE